MKGVKIAFAKSATYRSENHGCFGYNLKIRGSVSQQVWHVKEPSLFKAISAMQRSKFAVLSPVMLTAAR
jgi:hypothetical protein